jgi:hypothetical protein
MATLATISGTIMVESDESFRPFVVTYGSPLPAVNFVLGHGVIAVSRVE